MGSRFASRCLAALVAGCALGISTAATADDLSGPIRAAKPIVPAPQSPGSPAIVVVQPPTIPQGEPVPAPADETAAPDEPSVVRQAEPVVPPAEGVTPPQELAAPPEEAIVLPAEQDSPSVKASRLRGITIRLNPDSDLVPAVPPLGGHEADHTLYQGYGGNRGYGGVAANWDPTNLFHRPLLFEDVALERQGRHAGLLQPVASGAQFFGRVPFLPYLRGDEPATRRIFALGTPRPGSPGYPVTRPSLDPSLRGSVYQAGATVGGVFIVP